jgi:hypothetical protein
MKFTLINEQGLPVAQCEQVAPPVLLPGTSLVEGWPPARGMRWINSGWQVLTPQLAEVREARWQDIKAQREAREFGGFTWGGSYFDSDPISQSRIQGATILAMQAMAAAQPFSIDWTLADNTTRTLSAADMLAVGQALALHVITLHATARALRAAIEAAVSPEQVAAVAWP